MAIFYDDNARSEGPPPNLSRMNATKIWLSHFSNSLILTAIQQKPKDFLEKHQATKELGICQRKMAFWERHPKFQQQTAANEAHKLKSAWSHT